MNSVAAPNIPNNRPLSLLRWKTHGTFLIDDTGYCGINLIVIMWKNLSLNTLGYFGIPGILINTPLNQIIQCVAKSVHHTENFLLLIYQNILFLLELDG